MDTTLSETNNDIAVFARVIIGNVERWTPSNNGPYFAVMMKCRKGWNKNHEAVELMSQLLTLLESKGFSELEHGSGFTRASMPCMNYAFYRIYRHPAVDMYPSDQDILMSTHHASENLTGFMFSWNYNAM